MWPAVDIEIDYHTNTTWQEILADEPDAGGMAWGDSILGESAAWGLSWAMSQESEQVTDDAGVIVFPHSQGPGGQRPVDLVFGWDVSISSGEWLAWPDSAGRHVDELHDMIGVASVYAPGLPGDATRLLVLMALLGPMFGRCFGLS